MSHPGQRAERQVLYAFLRAGSRLAERVGASAKDVQEWARLAYFHELRDQGLTVARAAKRLGVSQPTAARLSRALKTDFLVPDVDHDLPRRLAFLLWAGPMSRERMAQVLTDVDGRDLDEALGRLLEEGRVEKRPGRTTTFAVRHAEDRLVRPGWAARLGALNRLLGNVADVVRARFFDASDHAFARTVAFRLRAEDHAALVRFYEDTLFPFLSDLEDRARDADDVEIAQLSILWASTAEPEQEQP